MPLIIYLIFLMVVRLLETHVLLTFSLVTYFLTDFRWMSNMQIRSFVDVLIERHMTTKPDMKS